VTLSAGGAGREVEGNLTYPGIYGRFPRPWTSRNRDNVRNTISIHQKTHFQKRSFPGKDSCNRIAIASCCVSALILPLDGSRRSA
jgi:hypothetical protein